MKKEFKEKYRKRLTKLLNTSLDSRNLITAINSWAVSVLTYSFGLLNYSDADLNELDRLTRRLLVRFRCHHPRSAVERLYLARNSGGRGLINIYRLCKTQEQKMRQYFQISEKELLRRVVAADKKYTPLNLSARDRANQGNTADAEITWREKVLHGKYPKALDAPQVDKAKSLLWLKKGRLHPETEGFLIAIQDGVIRTRNYEKIILKKEVEDKCRKCQQPRETIEHVIGSCPALADTAYLGRHNQVAKIVHAQLAQKYSLVQNPPPYYRYKPDPVLESPECVLYWDRPILTDRTVDYNRPDIVIIEKSTKNAIIIDIGCPLNHNLINTEVEKRNKYENLAIEIKHVWGMEQVKIVPIIITATGLVSTNLPNYLIQLGIQPNIIDALQKAVALQTCHIVRRFLGSSG